MNKKASDILKSDLLAFQTAMAAFPVVMGNEMLENVKSNFASESFNGAVWEKRKPNPKDDGHPVLKDTGKLESSFKRRQTKDSATVSTDVVYAKIHNEGGPGLAWGKHPFIMPKRQFLGDSEKLKTAILGKLQLVIAKIFK